MGDRENGIGNLLTGVVIGACLGAGITFLFGTKKGKEMREKMQSCCPEFFEKMDDVVGNLPEKYADVVAEVRKVEKEVAGTAVQGKVAHLGETVEKFGQELQSVSLKPHRFQRSGQTLKRVV